MKNIFGFYNTNSKITNGRIVCLYVIHKKTKIIEVNLKICIFVEILNKRNMQELKIQLDDKLVQTFGFATIEQQVADFISKLYLKISAQEMLKGIQEVDLVNDEKWKIARELAWKQESIRYIKFLHD